MMNKVNLVEFVAERGGLSIADAEAVVAFYRKIKVLKFNAHDGYQIAHGRFYDREVIRQALAMTLGS